MQQTLEPAATKTAWPAYSADILFSVFRPPVQEDLTAVPTRSEVEAIIAERISADPNFRDTLLADPRAALSEVIGLDIPDIVQVVLHEESLTQIHHTIPASEALSDADLELVAGAGWVFGGGGVNCGGGNCRARGLLPGPQSRDTHPSPIQH